MCFLVKWNRSVLPQTGNIICTNDTRNHDFFLKINSLKYSCFLSSLISLLHLSKHFSLAEWALFFLPITQQIVKSNEASMNLKRNGRITKQENTWKNFQKRLYCMELEYVVHPCWCIVKRDKSYSILNRNSSYKLSNAIEVYLQRKLTFFTKKIMSSKKMAP